MDDPLAAHDPAFGVKSRSGACSWSRRHCFRIAIGSDHRGTCSPPLLDGLADPEGFEPSLPDRQSGVLASGPRVRSGRGPRPRPARPHRGRTGRSSWGDRPGSNRDLRPHKAPLCRLSYDHRILVVGEGIEPPSSGYRPDALPLSYPTGLVPPLRIERRPSGLRPGAQTLYARAAKFCSAARRARASTCRPATVLTYASRCQTTSRLLFCFRSRFACLCCRPGRAPVAAKSGRNFPFANHVFRLRYPKTKNPIERVACGGLDGVLVIRT